jgi:hypothetical protein
MWGTPPIEVPQAPTWEEVQRRRRHFWFAAFGWLPFQMTFIARGGTASFASLLIWMGLCAYLQWRLSKAPCPVCLRPAVGHGFFLWRHARCQHCASVPPADRG